MVGTREMKQKKLVESGWGIYLALSTILVIVSSFKFLVLPSSFARDNCQMGLIHCKFLHKT
jgi:hypothetical protein